MQSQPLAGVLVVSLEQAVAAPFTTRQLADLGARVIKVERPGVGDFARGYDHAVRGMASHFVWANRSKESLTLDIKHAAGREVIDRLLERADVFVQNLAPGAVERLGWGAPELRARYPRLIWLGISGYGSGGPYRDRKAYDLLVQAEAALLSVTGTPETPSKAGISVADIAAGMYGFSGVLTALYRRALTGEGATLEVSMLEALAEWMGYPLYYALETGVAPERTGASHAAIAPYGPYTTGDGGSVLLGVQNEREWLIFCELVLERPKLATHSHFATNAERVAHRSELDEIIRAVFATRAAEQVVARLDAAGIAWARANTLPELIAHPQLAARERWRDVPSPAGPIPALLPPVTLDGAEPVMAAIPALGVHSDAILRELGYDDAAIARLHAEGVV